MNTKKIFSHSIRSIFGITILGLMLSSCSKDDMYTASPKSSVENSPRQPVADPFIVVPYEVIKINHIAARSSMPDYEVTIYSDMKALFEGRRNVSFVGKKYLTMDTRTYYLIKNMFTNSHLFEPQAEIAVNSGSELADLPMVMTSFNNGTHTVTLTDYNEERTLLYKIRTNAEMYLGIQDLIFNLSLTTQDTK